MSLLTELPQRTDTSSGAAGDLRERSALLRNITACYFLSGAAGLIYQILWLRKLLLVFGSSVHAVSTVLTVFFGGLALGSWLVGKLIDRREAAGLRWYGLLELSVGLYAFVTLPLFDVIQRVYIPIYRASDFSTAALVGGSFVCSAAILLVPTTLLGGTFPALNRFLIRASEERGPKIANLYAVNTIGAMTGTLLVYYVGLPILGLTRTLLCCGVVSLGIGLLCLVFDRHLATLGFHAVTPVERKPLGEVASGEEPAGLVRWLFAAFALSGFSAMAYEVAWTRALTLVLGSSIYAFCLILATVLGGIALGSFVAQHDLRRSGASVQQVIVLELFLGVYGFITVPLFNLLPQWFVTLWPVTGGSFGALSILQAILSAAIVAIPTILMGFLFPLVSELVTSQFARLGRRLGSAYAVNTLGGILGSFVSGFVLIPLWGLAWAIVIAALVNLLAGWLVYARFGRGRSAAARLELAGAALAGALVVGGAGIVPLWQRQVLAAGVYLNPLAYERVAVRQAVPAGSKLLYYRDSLNATVSVHQTDETLFLKVGGKTDASTGIDMSTQVLSAHLPMLLHRDPRAVLVIGLGSGITLGHASRYPLSVLHSAELDEAVVEAARYFAAQNFHVLEDPRARIFVVDGRNFLLASPQRYDVIISEPSNPWMAGLAYLFTKEFYELAKSRLAPGGIMCQWLQLYKIFPGDVKLMLKTFHEAFPHVSVWMTIPGDLLLIGSLEPHAIDYQTLAHRMAQPEIREALRVVRADHPAALLDSFWFGTHEVELATADLTWVHEDDQPSIEFDAPKALYLDRSSVLNLAGLNAFRASPELIAPESRQALEALDAQLAIASLWSYREDFTRAREILQQAVATSPQASEAWVRLGEVASQLGKPLEASEALTKASALDPADWRPYRLLGSLRCAEGDFVQAEQWYARAAGLAAPDATIAEEIGDCFSRAEQFAWAAEYYRSAISQGRGDDTLLVAAFARALKELQQLEAAEQVLRYGAAAFPQQAVFALQLGNVLLDQGRWPEAAAWFERTLRIAPKNAWAYYGLARCYVAQQDPATAVRLLRQGLRVQPYYREALELYRQLQRPSFVNRDS